MDAILTAVAGILASKDLSTVFLANSDPSLPLSEETINIRYRIDSFLLFSGIQSAINRVHNNTKVYPTQSFEFLLSIFQQLSAESLSEFRILRNNNSNTLIAEKSIPRRLTDNQVSESTYTVRDSIKTVKAVQLFANPSHFEEISLSCVVVSDLCSKRDFVLLSSLYESIIDAMNRTNKESKSSTVHYVSVSPILYSPDQPSKNRSRKWGPRIFLPFEHQNSEYPVNTLASWLVGTCIRGNVLISDCSVDRLTDLTSIQFVNILKATIPSQLWIQSALSLNTPSEPFKSKDLIFHLPRLYSLSIWSWNGKYVHIKKPIHILREIVSRRAKDQSVGTTKEHCIVVRSNGTDNESNDHLSVQYEAVPVGWWSNYRVVDASVSKESIDSSTDSNPTHCMCTLTIPISSELYDISGLKLRGIYLPSSQISVPTSSIRVVKREDIHEHDICWYQCQEDAEQNMALKALALFESSARRFLIKDDIIEGDTKGIMSSKPTYTVEYSLHISSKQDDSVCIYSSQCAVLGIDMVPIHIETELSRMISSNIRNSSLSLHPTHVFGSLSECWNPAPRMNAPSECSCDVSIDVRIELLEFERYVEESVPMYRPRIFHPPLSDQRKNLVQCIVQQCESNTWLDAGCGNASFIINLLKSKGKSSLRHVYGIDINPIRLGEAKNIIETMHSELNSNIVLSEIESIHLLEGSLLDKESCECIGHVDIVSCIEVIEHLPSIVDATLATVNILQYMQPKIFIVSTPNYESNRVIRKESLRQYDMFYFGPRTIDNVSNEECQQNEKYRELDHKFEFTRYEFREWILGILAQLKRNDPNIQYEIDMLELGCQLSGMEGTGGATQVVIFRNTNSMRCPSVYNPIKVNRDDTSRFQWMYTKEKCVLNI